MASRGRGRGLKKADNNSPPGGMKSPSPQSDSDPIGENVLAPPPVQLPEKPTLGKAGRTVTLITNHFEVKMPSTTTLFHYDLEITQATRARNQKIVWTSGKAKGLPRNEIRDRCYEIYLAWIEECRLNIFEMVYDRQKNLYTLNDLKELGHQTTKVITHKRESYNVTLTLCNPATIVLSPQTIGSTILDVATNSRDRSPLQILDLIMNQFLFYMYAMKKTDFMHFGRHFYRPRMDRQGNFHELAYGRMIYEGFFKSLRLVMGTGPLRSVGTTSVLTLNVDSKKAPFFMELPLIQTVLATVGQFRGDPKYLTDQQIKHLNHHLKEIRVRTNYGDVTKTFMMMSFTNVPASKQTFLLDNRPVNVNDYYYNKYGTQLKYPHFPCVRKKGGPGKTDYYPMEVVIVVPHQKVDLKKTAEDQSRELIKVSAVPPEERLNDIYRMAAYTDSSRDLENKFAATFKVSRSADCLKIEGRLLVAPRIQFRGRDNRGGGSMVEVRNGQWNLQNQQLYAPVAIEKFAVVALTTEQRMNIQVINNFTQNLAGMARNLGINMPPNCSVGDYCKDNDVEDVLRQLSKKGFKFVICIMGEHIKTEKIKSEIKRCEANYTLITQCIKEKTVFRCHNKPGDEIYKNLVLKVNAKNGGVNNELDMSDPIARKWFRPGIMYVGMDVNHPPPLSKAEIAQGMLPKEPSVVGAVANCGRSFSDYRMRFYLQDARQEEIAERHMIDMYDAFIKEYAENNKNMKPDTIIVYRDGVSDSQYKMVVEREVLAMKQAFANISSSYSPKLTVITVQKRHNTRFFKEQLTNTPPDRLRQMRGAEKNIAAGTVVDTGPVTSKLFDFYLCSHAGLQGTSKAPYYVVVHDEVKFTADELHNISFQLCHGYQRCNKSVSLPAPCFHAHHAASRGKQIYAAEISQADDSSSGISSNSSDGSSQANKGAINYETLQKKIQYGPLNNNTMIWV